MKELANTVPIFKETDSAVLCFQELKVYFKNTYLQ